MVKRPHKNADTGLYHINGKRYEILIGSRAQVWHGTAYKTAGDLTKDKLMMNKHGRIVSKKKHTTAMREKRLKRYGYTARKGKFGAVKIGDGSSVKRRRRTKRRTRSRRGSRR